MPSMPFDFDKLSPPLLVSARATKPAPLVDTGRGDSFREHLQSNANDAAANAARPTAKPAAPVAEASDNSANAEVAVEVPPAEVSDDQNEKDVTPEEAPVTVDAAAVAPLAPLETPAEETPAMATETPDALLEEPNKSPATSQVNALKKIAAESVLHVNEKEITADVITTKEVMDSVTEPAVNDEQAGTTADQTQANIEVPLPSVSNEALVSAKAEHVENDLVATSQPSVATAEATLKLPSTAPETDPIKAPQKRSKEVTSKRVAAQRREVESKAGTESKQVKQQEQVATHHHDETAGDVQESDTEGGAKKTLGDVRTKLRKATTASTPVSAHSPVSDSSDKTNSQKPEADVAASVSSATDGAPPPNATHGESNQTPTHITPPPTVRSIQTGAARAAERIAGAARVTEAEQSRFLQRVTKAFQAAQDRDGEIRLRLSPPELGSLRLELKLHAGTLTAKIEAETQSAKTLLLENLPVLRERLAEQGIRVENFDVDLMDRHPTGQQPNSSEQREQPSNPTLNTATQARVFNREREANNGSPSRGPTKPINNGRLNVIV